MLTPTMRLLHSEDEHHCQVIIMENIVEIKVFTVVVMKSIIFWFLAELISSTLKMEAMFLRNVG
jgi:hypothetical protein